MQRVVAHATTLIDSVRAVHRWVAQDIRYVQIALGLGGFQPRFPDTVLATGFGDCKDKATLLIDALGLIGLQAFPVLISATNQPDSTLPTIQAFDHEIVAVKQPTGYQYVDPTSELSRFGTLPYTDAGKFALIVHPAGDIEHVTTPPDPTDSNRSVVSLTGELASDGTFSGRVEVTTSGALELWLRALMSPTQDTAERTATLQSLVSTTIPDVKIDSLVSFDGKDFAAKPALSFVIRNAHPTQRSGDVDILPLVDRSAAFKQMAYGVARYHYRGQPIDAERILPTATLVSETHKLLQIKSGKRDSNPRPQPWQGWANGNSLRCPTITNHTWRNNREDASHLGSMIAHGVHNDLGARCRGKTREANQEYTG